MDTRIVEVIKFWEEAGPKAWFAKSDEFDDQIRTRFTDLHREIAGHKHDHWRENAEGCLAMVLVLDQFSRNMFRDDARAFAQDDQALELAKFGIEQGYDTKEPVELYRFLHMPFMHAEDLAEQERCVELFEQRPDATPDSTKWAIIHRDIIARFGRFPHRNKVLGRETTAQEQAFLDEGGFSG